MYPAGVIGTTAENLKASAMGENEEWTELYPHFAEVAAQEGFPKIAAKFKMIAKAEVNHETRFLKFLDNLDNDKVFTREEPKQWQCRNCGYVHEGNNAPNLCPSCEHPQAYFELKPENF